MKKIITLLSIIAFISCKNNSSSLPEETTSLDSISIDTLAVGETIPKVDSAKIKELKSFFNYKTDEFSTDKTTWITPKTAAPYRNQNGTYLYFSKNNLRFVFQYHNDDWLFINKCQFLIDGKPFEFIPTEMKRDNDESGITEWFDESINNSNVNVIEALANAKSAKVKLIGDQYVDYKVITSKQLIAFKKTLEYYKALGYTFL